MTGFLTTDQVCVLFDIKPATVRDWKRRGLLRAYAIAGRRVWKCDEVEEASRAAKPRRARCLTQNQRRTTLPDQSGCSVSIERFQTGDAA